MDSSRQPGVQFGQIFLSEAHFTQRADALSLPHDTAHRGQEIEVQVMVKGAPDGSAAALTVRVKSKPDPEALYQFHVEMTALVQRVPGEENLDPREYAANMGPAALYPFLREAIASLTLRGRFGAVWLKPFNFTAAQPVPIGESSQRQRLPAARRPLAGRSVVTRKK